MNHQIFFESDLEEEFPYALLLDRVITAALEAEGVKTPCEVDVLITDDEGIHQINLEQRGIDRPTDVLSFPMFNYLPGCPPTDDSDADPGDVYKRQFQKGGGVIFNGGKIVGKPGGHKNTSVSKQILSGNILC